jgi:hypothetical protein
VLLGRQALVAEEDHAVLVERLPDVGNGIRVERVRQIDSKSSAPSAPDVGRTSNRVFRMATPPARQFHCAFASF